MLPGVAFFYGGMVRAKHVLGMLMQNFSALAVGSVLWVLLGFSLAFGPGNKYLGGLGFAGLEHLGATVPGYPDLQVPPMALVAFQMMFAVVTVALITGATADRWRFAPYLAFAALWSLLVYAPVARWVFSPEGWANQLGALDFAGGTVVHANSGAAAAAAVLTWVATERVRYGKPTTLGAASGAIAGLVAVTPCAGYVSPLGSLLVGAVAGVICALLVSFKTWIGLDDSLDVAAVHLGGGVVGSLCVGLFATRAVNPQGADGLFYGGGYTQLGYQALAVVAVAAYSFVVTFGLGAFLDRLLGNRVSPRSETIGLDLAEHGEAAYQLEVADPLHVARSDQPRSDVHRSDLHRSEVARPDPPPHRQFQTTPPQRNDAIPYRQGSRPR